MNSEKYTTERWKEDVRMIEKNSEWGYMCKIKIEDTEKICKLYSEEENINISPEYLESAILAHKKMIEKGDFVLGAYDLEFNLLACLSVHFMDELYPGYTKGPYIHVETIIVGKKFRGRGIATDLLKQVLKIAEYEGVTYIIAQTANDNFAMRKAYENAGFEHHNVNYTYEFVTTV